MAAMHSDQPPGATEAGSREDWIVVTTMHRRFIATIFILMFLGSFARPQNQHEKARFCFIGAGDFMDSSAPHFDQYFVNTAPPSSPVKLDVHSNSIARMYRTVIRHEMSQGPNFAGHYRVAIWGCGSSCAQFAVVNLTTGKVVTVHGVDSVSGVHLGADDFLPGTDSGAWGFRFKRNSRLLVLVGTINEDDSKEGAFYYLLTREKLVLLHKTAATRNTCIEKQD